MIRPIMQVAALEGWAQGSTPPDGITSHFADRCRDRGVPVGNAERLKWFVQSAYHADRQDVLERVFDNDPGSTVYRILVRGVPFYPVIRGGIAVTIYNRDTLRQLRRVRRLRRKYTGNRQARY